MVLCMDVQELQRWNQVRSNLELLYNRLALAAVPPDSDLDITIRNGKKKDLTWTAVSELTILGVATDAKSSTSTGSRRPGDTGTEGRGSFSRAPLKDAILTLRASTWQTLGANFCKLRHA